MDAGPNQHERAVRVVRPQPGPQELFLGTPADIAFYGGSAGGGKSWAMCVDPLRWHGVADFTGIIFRRLSTEIRGGGGIWQESRRLYPATGGVARESPAMEWRWPSGATIEFSHLQHESDVHDHQSKQYAFVGFEELTGFTAKQFWYMVSRNRSTCGVRPYTRATLNPDPDHFSRDMVDWWIGPDGYAIPERSGVIRWLVRLDDDTLEWADTREELVAKYPDAEPISFTFIMARLKDNPALTKKDPTYKSKLKVLAKVDRERLLGDEERGGNWNIRPAAGDYFKRSYFPVVDVMPADVVRRVRGWDKAATKPTPQNPDPDWTAGVRVSKDAQGRYYIEHVEFFRESPGENEVRIRRIAESDGAACEIAQWQDPGSGGKSDAHHYATSVLAGFAVHTHPAGQSKETYAKPWSSQAEHGNIYLVRGPWNDRYLSVLEGFPSAAHEDEVDATSVAFLELAGPGFYLV